MPTSTLSYSLNKRFLWLRRWVTDKVSSLKGNQTRVQLRVLKKKKKKSAGSKPEMKFVQVSSVIHLTDLLRLSVGQTV